MFYIHHHQHSTYFLDYHLYQYHYPIIWSNLFELYVKHGTEVEKVHKINLFEQSKWLEQNISSKFQIRKGAKMNLKKTYINCSIMPSLGNC